MKTTKKLILASFAVVLLAAGCAKQQAAQSQPVVNNQSQAQATPVPTPTPTPSISSGPSATPTPVQRIGQITVTQTVEGSNLNKPSYTAPIGENAMDLLKGSHTVLTKTYSGIGEYVTSIDGNAADSKHFWEFFVNGKSSNVGASDYKLQNGDKIEWKLSAIN